MFSLYQSDHLNTHWVLPRPGVNFGTLHTYMQMVSIQLLSRLFFMLWAVWGPGSRRRSRIQNNLRWIRKNLRFKFFQFLMTVNGFFWHGGLGDISMFTVDAKNTHSFIFSYRFQLFSEANSLTLSHVWSQWYYWKFSNVSSSNFLILRIQVLVNSSGGIYKRCYFCLSQLPKIKKESTANTFVGQRSRGGHKEPVGLTVLI